MRGIRETQDRSTVAEGNSGDFKTVARPFRLGIFCPEKTADSGRAVVAGSRAFDPFINDARHRDPTEHLGTFGMQVQLSAYHTLTAQWLRIEVDQEKLLNALELELR